MKSSDEPMPVRRANDEQAPRFARRFGESLRVGDARMAERVVGEALQAGFDAGGVNCRVITPAMHWIGELWERGAITTADEHLATAISHSVLARLFPRLLNAAPRSRERVMLAAAQGEHHVLGLQMVADMLEGAGFDVLYLGADVPRDALLAACELHRPVVLGLGATMPLNLPTLLSELVELSRLEFPPRLFVGGLALPSAVKAGMLVPLVVSADLAVATVEALLAGGPQGPPLSQALLQTIPPRGDDSAAVGIDDIGTIPDHFSGTVLAAAETARDSARRAYGMEQLALRDPLTGTWNRRGFDDRIADADEQPGDAILLMIDIDHFKTVNDTWGHDTGDATLAAVAQMIERNVRPSDFVARYGGDEFIVLLPSCSLAEGKEIAERVRAGVAGAVIAPPVTVSIGLADYSGDHRLSGITVDQALYTAKTAGRNRVAIGAG